MRSVLNRREYILTMGAGAMGTVWAPWLAGCGRHVETPGVEAVVFRNGTWIGDHVDDGSLDAWKRKFAALKQSRIDAVLLKLPAEQLEPLIPAAANEGVEIHAWMIAMMQGGMEDAHHEWYVVNRNGESAADKPAYVDYYKFMCPSREPVQEHVLGQVARLAQLDGLKSVHLDYIRYPDVILPVALWDTYGIVQDREYPQYDYCYCDVCREAFRAKTGSDPMEIEDPPSNEDWLQYRYDTVTHVVNRLADKVHEHGKAITAAVFPTPSIAKQLVRQDWVNWNLDAVMPMIYNWFYAEPVSWVETATREGVEALAGRIPLYAGLYVPELTPDELAKAVRSAARGGARGAIIFEGKMPTEAHWSNFSVAVEALKNT